MLKLLSLITRRKIVLLLDFEGKIYRTIESKKINPFTGVKFCYVYWWTKVGLINLHEKGKTTGRCYIEKWTYEL